ncbi:MAG: DEAD/DEAH box helicase family protein [Phenylobacterium sp.]|uniref:DEAD/DEAH box helicase n=1 Tax=Phenylobacterium sp. TaxID=1871053 RepID=UPI002733BE1E|nr:DEAD/DEAH box helicase family protein [Phenylobacterium sp.]MDP3175834.1 DEAD/DEAH box helicase family protein [Phenylobacterium sp.]
MFDLFSTRAVLRLPERIAVFGRLSGNLVRRLAETERTLEVVASEHTSTHGRSLRCTSADGFTFAIVDRDTTSLQGCSAVLRVEDISSVGAVVDQLNSGKGSWILPRPRKPGTGDRAQVAQATNAIALGWKDQLQLVAEDFDGERQVRRGLRPPQIGAIYATKAHWSVSALPATLVLPTGAGKTDTMVSLLVSERIRRLLVIVPTDPLRRQIAEKFMQLGVLKTFGCLSADAAHPSVALLSRGLKTVEDLDALVAESNVVVATMQVLSGMSVELQARLAELMSHLFFDEAHHIGARTWRDFKLHFAQRTVLQFTATPFRNDGRRVDGKFIYVYPLRRAQQDQLFTAIKYVPVHGLDVRDADRQIIDGVGAQLEEDLARGFNHLVMARTNSVDRAEELHAAYTAKLPEYQPQLIHNKMSPSQRASALNELRAGRSRVIVCVDMLGEGFDLPDLKIAALHDKHRSEAVTLQFVGRFTRARSDLGTATVIANVTIDDMNQNLKALYAEDADWNQILSVIGHSRTERERRREDLFAGFANPPETFPLETLEPRFSTVVYRTKCTEWTPEAAALTTELGSTIIEPPVVNAEGRLVIFVRRDEERLRWTSVKSARNVEFNLVMAHWDADQELLFINSSKLGDLHLDLAKRLAGSDVELIRGEDVFRVLHGFRRLVLMNLGLSETQRKPVRYSQFMGSDIADPLDTLAGNRSRTKTNLFGQGYVDIEDHDENGAVVGSTPSKETIGCSAKGKIWSYQSTNSFSEWIDWCHALGAKLLNENITSESILRNIVRPKRITVMPEDKIPIAIAWPERFLYDVEDRIFLEIGGGDAAAFFNCEIELTAFAPAAPIRFRVTDGVRSAQYSLAVSSGGVTYSQVGGDQVIVRRGRKETPLLDVFREDPPHVYFADGDMLVATELFVLRRDDDFTPYDPAKIEAVDWTGVNLRRESQGADKRADSIQGRIIERLKRTAAPYDVIFDDDGAGEVADVVALRRSGRTLTVDLFHCKYSSAAAPGSRVEDLYEVCGQAQKSVRWAERFDELLHHLRRREVDRQRRGSATRFEQGNMATLIGLIGHWREMRPEFSVTIVQPGYSRSKAAKAHLELFAATESYLMETWRMPLTILASA